MKRFQFRLERFLQLRRYREREWELKLADITGQCIILANKIKECTDNISITLGKRQFPTGMLNLYGLFENELFIQRMKQQITFYSQELTNKNKQREEVKKQYLEVSRARKVLEKLKDKREAEYYDKLKRDLQEEKIIFFLMQVPFHIPGGTKYLVDFVVFDSKGTVRFIDVKGYETPQFKLKKKLVEQFYPVNIEVVK